MSRKYQKLNYHLRNYIEILLKENLSFRKISKVVGVSHTTVSREVNKHSAYLYGNCFYNAGLAEAIASEKIVAPHRKKIMYNSKLKRTIKWKLLLYWNPNEISGWLRKKRPNLYVSHETIYKYIYEEKPQWIKYLARGLRKRHRRARKTTNRQKTSIKHRIGIENRPKAVGNRSTFGHFEVDCIVSRLCKTAILVIIERKTRFVKLIKVDRKSAQNIHDHLNKSLFKFRKIVKTITYDNGTENAYHYLTNKILMCKSFFCNPYSSWQKGSVENVIGIVRRFIPKKKNLSKLSERDLQKVENIINLKPRKILDYKTAKEMFKHEWCIVA